MSHSMVKTTEIKTMYQTLKNIQNHFFGFHKICQSLLGTSGRFRMNNFKCVVANNMDKISWITWITLYCECEL